MKTMALCWIGVVVLAIAAAAALAGPETTIPIEILKQYDPEVFAGKRPSWVAINDKDILDLREHPNRGDRQVKLRFDPAKLSDEQKTIVSEWLRGGHNPVFVEDQEIEKYAELLGIRCRKFPVTGESQPVALLISKDTPIGTDVGKVTMTPYRARRWRSETPQEVAYYSLEESGLEDLVVAARYDLPGKPAAMGKFRLGKTTVFFEPRGGADGADSYRFMMNWRQWRMGYPVPGPAPAVTEANVLEPAPLVTGNGVVAYPPHPKAISSEVYSVTVNGVPVFVHDYPTYGSAADKEGSPGGMAYAHFSMSEKATVTVTFKEGAVKTCNVSPRAYGITPTISGNTVTFELDKPKYAIVFINEPVSFKSRGLMLFAEPPEEDAPKLTDENVTNILDYKVDVSGKTVETDKINKAIADVSAKPEGGVLFFPGGGIYRTGTIMMKPNVTLYVQAGALIQGSTDKADYPNLYEHGGSGKGTFAFIDAPNSGLTGRGTIDGAGYPELYVSGKGKVGIYGYKIIDSPNVLFQDLILRRAHLWTVHLIGSDHFTSRNVKIINRKTKQNEDIYDFCDGSSHILVENGFGLTMDDFFTMKGSRRSGEKPIEDIVVKGFVGYGYDSGLAIGYSHWESNYSIIKDVLLEDVHNISNGIDFGVFLSFTKGSETQYQDDIVKPLENFRFVNWTFEEGRWIYLSAGESPFKNFSFENCTVYDAPNPGKITGTNFEGLSFKNLRIGGKVITSAEELRKTGIDITVPATFEP